MVVIGGLGAAFTTVKLGSKSCKKILVKFITAFRGGTQ